MNENNDIVKKAKLIIRGYLDDNPVHGIPHVVEEVYEKHFSSLKQDPESLKKIGGEMLDTLGLAVLFHDIGFKNGCKHQHAQRSAKILRTTEKYFFDSLPNKWMKDVIIYAAEHHPGGDGVPDNKHRCLALLTLLDHMDAIGVRGKNRTISYLNDERLSCGECHPNPNFVCDVVKEKVREEKDRLESYFIDFEKIKENDLAELKKRGKELSPFKDCDIFLHMLCNYCWIDSNRKRVDNLLGENFKNYYDKLKKDTQDILVNYKNKIRR